MYLDMKKNSCLIFPRHHLETLEVKKLSKSLCLFVSSNLLFVIGDMVKSFFYKTDNINFKKHSTLFKYFS